MSFRATLLLVMVKVWIKGTLTANRNIDTATQNDVVYPFKSLFVSRFSTAARQTNSACATLTAKQLRQSDHVEKQ